MMIPFAPEASALAPTGNFMSLARPYNKRTNSGWFVTKTAGVCGCGKPYAVGNEIAYGYGKQSGCYWCARDLAPTAGDVAAFGDWRVRYLAAIPASVDDSTEVRREVLVEMMGYSVPVTFRAMVAEVASRNEALTAYEKMIARAERMAARG
jgi:hypothetical protein